jgi:hypothetical protein
MPAVMVVMMVVPAVMVVMPPMMVMVVVPPMMVMTTPVVMMVMMATPVMMVMLHLLHHAFLRCDGLRRQRSRRYWSEKSCSHECGRAEGHFHEHQSYSV